jgi:hypothetical protein
VPGGYPSDPPLCETEELRPSRPDAGYPPLEDPLLYPTRPSYMYHAPLSSPPTGCDQRDLWSVVHMVRAALTLRLAGASEGGIKIVRPTTYAEHMVRASHELLGGAPVHKMTDNESEEIREPDYSLVESGDVLYVRLAALSIRHKLSRCLLSAVCLLALCSPRGLCDLDLRAVFGLLFHKLLAV